MSISRHLSVYETSAASVMYLAFYEMSRLIRNKEHCGVPNNVIHRVIILFKFRISVRTAQAPEVLLPAQLFLNSLFTTYPATNLA